MILVNSIILLLLLYFGWAVLYQLSFSVAGHFYRPPAPGVAAKYRRIAVMIPAYREDAVILEVAQRALEQDYPSDRYGVIIIADTLQTATLKKLRDLPLRVIEVAFAQSTKSKALNCTLEQLPAEDYDIALILDADNVMAPDFLQRINRCFEQGARIVQGQRSPKNLDTPMAVLDGASESINNHILCAGHRTLGFSARLAGSGMAFDFDLFREIMPRIKAIGGFDKELELRLTQKGEVIHYDAGARVLDEKVREAEVFSNQRSRWIQAQFSYARRFSGPALRALFKKRNIDFFNKALQMWLPPRLLTPGFLTLAAGISLLSGSLSYTLLWIGLLAGNILSFALGMPGYLFEKSHRQAFWRLPAAFLATLGSLLKSRRAAGQFIHTPHGERGGKGS